MANDSATHRAERRDGKFKQVFASMIIPSEFYEPLHAYKPGPEFSDVAMAVLPVSWRLRNVGVWTNCQPPRPEFPMQGWKIHVSATPANATDILRKVIPVCVANNTTFKFAADPGMFAFMNSKSWSRGGSGKFMTLYPQSKAVFIALLDELYEQLKNFEGPYVLSDKRYKDCKVLYYRYGGLKALQRLEVTGGATSVLLAPEDGEVPDQRTPYFNPPAWVSDPFPDLEEDEGDLFLKEGRYLIESILGTSNAGNVYTATDTLTGKEVVIKEARPFTASDGHSSDAVSRLKKEHAILTTLQGTGIAAEPVDLFWDWEHLFMVQSFVPGITVAHFNAINNVSLKAYPDAEKAQAWLEHVHVIATSIAKSLQVLHDNGVIFGDFSPNNIILDETTFTATFIDFEGAYLEGSNERVSVLTPGFASDRQGRHHLIPSDDYYAFGAVLLSLLSPVNGILQIKPDAAEHFSHALIKDFGFPEGYKDLILDLLVADPAKRLAPQDVLTRLAAPGMRSATELMIHTPAVSTPEALSSAITSIREFILASRDTSRKDRLFPAGPFMVNGLSIDHGALGVAYALDKLGTDLPDDVWRWIEKGLVSHHQYAPALHSGLAGMAWALHELGHNEHAETLLNAAFEHPLLYKSFNLAHGAAGVGLSHIHAWHKTHNPRYLERATTIATVMLSYAHTTPEGTHWQQEQATKFIGYHQGSSGVAMFLMHLYAATRNDTYLQVAKNAIDYDLNHGITTKEGVLSFPEDTEFKHIVYPYLATGSAGVGSAVLRYYQLSKDETYRQKLELLLPDTRRKYAVFMGLFNGLAGLGNFLLDCYCVLGDARFYEAALKVSDGIRLFGIQKDTGLAFPGDYLYRLSTDYATGSAGIGLFFQRLVTRSESFDFVIPELLAQAHPVLVTAGD